MAQFIGYNNNSKVIVWADDIQTALGYLDTAVQKLGIEDQPFLVNNCIKGDVVMTYTRFFSEPTDTTHNFIVVRSDTKHSQSKTSLAKLIKE